MPASLLPCAAGLVTFNYTVTDLNTNASGASSVTLSVGACNRTFQVGGGRFAGNACMG